jgi:hypothetical protein
MSGKILFVSGRTNGRSDDLAAGNIKVGDKALGAMADVFKLRTFRRSRPHG